MRLGKETDRLLASLWLLAWLALPVAMPAAARPAPVGAETALDGSRVNATARLLAGIAPDDPALAALARTPAWKAHSAIMSSAWARIRTGRVAAMRAWRDKYLPANCPVGKTLLYPFSGPDFFNAYWLFPECDTFVLFGLEHIGRVPNVGSMREHDFASLLLDVRVATSDLFNRNYFITDNMTRQLRTVHLRGVVPLILISMALSDLEIVRIAPLRLQPLADAAAARPTQVALRGRVGPPVKRVSLRKPRGIEIDFRAAGSPVTKRLIYFTVDATDGSLAMYPEFLAFLRRFAPSTTLLKSASYLLHGREFTRLRDLLLDVSQFLVQDDTGLPYHMLIARGWKVRVHGRYKVPIAPFKGDYQPDLYAAYQAQHPEVLPFPFGYVHKGRSNDRANLMVAQRIPAPKTARSASAGVMQR